MSQPASQGASPGASPRFQVVRFLGKGGQGFVQLVTDTLTGQPCAVKYIDRGWSRSFYKYVSREILNHASLSLCKHPHVVEFYEVFLTPRYLGIVMEYVDGTNLQQYLEANGGKLAEDVARFIFQQLMIAVDFCHKKGKVNRDIKLANVLLQLNGTQLPLVKLCDFGFSKDKFDDSEPQTQIGTALFTAPEIFTNTQGQVYDAEAADVWSCGIVLYVMLFGGHPFLSFEDCHMKKHAQVMKLISNSVSGTLMWPPEAAQCPVASDLIARVLVSKPGERYKISDILQHPWFLEKLPPGALVLNDAYLSMRVSTAEARQSPDTIKQIVRAAVSVNSAEIIDRNGAAVGVRPGTGPTGPSSSTSALSAEGPGSSAAVGPGSGAGGRPAGAAAGTNGPAAPSHSTVTQATPGNRQLQPPMQGAAANGVQGPAGSRGYSSHTAMNIDAMSPPGTGGTRPPSDASYSTAASGVGPMQNMNQVLQQQLNAQGNGLAQQQQQGRQLTASGQLLQQQQHNGMQGPGSEGGAGSPHSPASSHQHAGMGPGQQQGMGSSAGSPSVHQAGGYAQQQQQQQQQQRAAQPPQLVSSAAAAAAFARGGGYVPDLSPITSLGESSADFRRMMGEDSELLVSPNAPGDHGGGIPPPAGFQGASGHHAGSGNLAQQGVQGVGNPSSHAYSPQQHQQAMSPQTQAGSPSIHNMGSPQHAQQSVSAGSPLQQPHQQHGVLNQGHAAGGAASRGLPGNMDISGNVLMDSSILLQMNLDQAVM